MGAVHRSAGAGEAPLYDIAELRDRWRKAARRLQSASSIALLGYSLPVQDFATHALITRAATSNMDLDLPDPHELCPRVGVADLDPGPVVDRLEVGGIAGVSVLGTGTSSIKDAVHALSNDVWLAAADHLERTCLEPDSTPLTFAFGVAGMPRNGIANDDDVLRRLTTATEFIEAANGGALDGVLVNDRAPVGLDPWPSAPGVNGEVQVRLGVQR